MPVLIKNIEIPPRNSQIRSDINHELILSPYDGAQMPDMDAMVHMDDILDAQFMGNTAAAATTTNTVIAASPSSDVFFSPSDHMDVSWLLKCKENIENDGDYDPNSTSEDTPPQHHAVYGSPHNISSYPSFSMLHLQRPPMPLLPYDISSTFMCYDNVTDDYQSSRIVSRASNEPSIHRQSKRRRIVADFEIEEEENGDVKQWQNERFGTDYASTSTRMSEQDVTQLDKLEWDEEDVPIGFTFHKYFPKFGWFQGTVIEIRVGAKDNKTRRVSYCDGDSEDLSIAEILKSVHDYSEISCSNSNTQEDEEEKEEQQEEQDDDACTQKSVESRRHNPSCSADVTSSKSNMKNKEKETVATAISIKYKPSKHDAHFDERLDMLREYKTIHGHVDVPTKYKNRKLAKWCKTLRSRYKQWASQKLQQNGERKSHAGSITYEQIKRLEELGFKWNLKAHRRVQYFESQFQKLLEFKMKHGHVEVSQTIKSDRILYAWCKRIRRDFRECTRNDASLCGPSGLTEEYAQRLRDVGFRFEADERKTFEERIDELREFKIIYGHVDLSRKTNNIEEYNSLSLWCSQLRSAYNLWENKLSNRTRGLNDERVKILKEMGFKFKVKRGGRGPKAIPRG